ncbi:MAG: site-2 protease family protein [Pyrinomonadaceae bacterium]
MPKEAMLYLWLITSLAMAMIIHEIGHLIAARRCHVSASELSMGVGPKLFAFRLGKICYSLRALPLGSFVRLDGKALTERSLRQQLFVHLGGIALNLIFGFITYGTVFGWMNLLLAGGNLLPLYQHDGWKCGVVLMRAFLQRNSQPVEWVFTFSGGIVSLVIAHAIIRSLI